ncbi:MAG TPA: carotenoid biosynthesis protein [Armatimonadota bacterium]|nr:carotenoid biosynthesis protein [Armatimonadota bacterium]
MGANVATCATASLLCTVASQGWRRALFLFALCVAVSFGMEGIGTATGVPYGEYSYTELIGPKLPGSVPHIIPVAWFMMMAPALAIGRWLCSVRWQQALVAAGLMLLWDVALDPAATGDFPLWRWHGGSGFYGIPTQNWIGWFGTAFTIAGCYVWVVPSWRAGGGRMSALIYVVQGALAATAAVASGRWWAAVVWGAGMALFALLAYRSVRRAKDRSAVFAAR